MNTTTRPQKQAKPAGNDARSAAFGGSGGSGAFGRIGRRLVVGAAVTCAVVAGQPLVALMTASAASSTTSVSGTVFRDLNSDGVKNGNEQFLAGVFVRATGQNAGTDTVLNTH